MHSMIMMQGGFVTAKEAARLDASVDIALDAGRCPKVFIHNNFIEARKSAFGDRIGQIRMRIITVVRSRSARRIIRWVHSQHINPSRIHQKNNIRKQKVNIERQLSVGPFFNRRACSERLIETGLAGKHHSIVSIKDIVGL